MVRFLLALGCLLGFLTSPGPALAQCTGSFPANTVCGTTTGGIPHPIPPPSSGVSSLNSITGAANITAGSNVTVTPAGQNIQISSTGGGGNGLNILRSAISTTNTLGASFTVTGFSVVGDAGSGAPYICTGQSSASIGAMMDSAGNWCALDVKRVSGMNGFQPGWFGAAGTGIGSDISGLQQAVDASYNSGINNVYCPSAKGSYPITYPLYDDPPTNLRGQGKYLMPQTTTYAPGSIVGSPITVTPTTGASGTGTTATITFTAQTSNFPVGSTVTVTGVQPFGYNGQFIVTATSSTSISYANTTIGGQTAAGTVSGLIPFANNGNGPYGNTGIFGQPGAPDMSGEGLDLAYVKVSATTPVAYHPTFTNASVNAVAEVTYKGSGTIGTPTLVLRQGYIASGPSAAVTGNAAIGTTVVLAVEDYSGVGITGVNDSKGNTYTRRQFADRALVNGLYLFDSVLTFALVAGTDTITVTAPGGAYVAVAVDVTGLTATPFDQTAVQNNLTVATNTPTVSTPTLSQTNEIIFGAIAGDQTLIGYGFVESSTMTTTTPNGWSAGTWDSGTTYNAGDRVIFENIPWQSLKNSNTGNNPQSDLNLNVALVNWQPISVTPTIFGPGSTFHGDPKLTPGQLKGGCVIVSQFNNAAAFALPTGNGNTVENVYIYGNDNSHLHCGQPNTGVAFAGLSGTGGPNRTKLVNVGVQNFYMALGFGLASIQNIGNAGGANLGAENHVHNAFVANACYGFAVRNQQGFMNSVYDSDFDATNMILTNSEVGVEVLGGNYSTENGIAPGAKFAMSGVSAAYIGGGPNGIEITATLTVAGDPYMTDPLSDCNDVRGVGVVNLFPNTFCEGAVYNSFMLHTADYGVIPLIMTSWNHTTRAATFWVLNSWFTAFGTACCGSALTTEINAQANVWAAEMVRTFSGAGIVAERLHIETTQPWQLTDSTIGFGAPDATVLRSIKINAPIDNCGSYSPGNAQSEAWCFSQQEFPWINVGSDIVIQDICCNAGITEFNMVDFPQAITNGGGHMNVRGWQMGQFNFRYPANTIFTNIGNLTGGDGGYGSPAFGSGNYDVSPFTGAALPGQSNTNSVDQAWLDRTQGIGASPFVGTRPAPWSTPCLSPLQEAKVLNVNNSLPIPYLDGNGAWQINYPLLFSGQQYRICSFGGGLDSTAWSNAVGYFQGSVVTNAGTTYVSMVGSGDFLSNLNHTPGTAMTFTGSIANTECASPPANTGAFTGCLTVTATGVAGQILINSPVTGAGVAAGTTIIAQATGSSGSTGTYVIVPRQTVASETLTANYWASLGATPHFGIVSNHGGGYSYGIDFTTATNNGLSWSEANASPFFNLTGGRFDQLFPGTVVGLAGTQAGCTTQENFVIRGIHQTLLFFDTFRIDQDIGGGIVPGFSGATCSNTVMHQAPYSIVNLN